MNPKIDQLLLHLYDCVDYGCSYRLKKGIYISEYFDHWKKELNTKEIKSGILNLNRQKLIIKETSKDGSMVISLTEKGKLRAINTSFKKFYNKKEKWDGKWRMIAFDIPNTHKKGRNALRYRFKLGGFYELQESLFLYPYECKKELTALVELFKLQKYVRYGLLDFIDNEEEIKKKIGLN